MALMTETRDTIRRNLIASRHAAGLSQRELAETIGAHRSQVVDWEAGRFRPGDDYIGAWAEATGHTVGWFFDPHDEPEAAA